MADALAMNQEESKLAKVGAVQVYAHRDDQGRAGRIEAYDEDGSTIAEIADRLQKLGYGVMRRQKHRAGRLFHHLQANWAAPGEPPTDPLR